MKTIGIQAEPRNRTGKGGAREARRQGRIPGILYGQGKMVAISVDRREFVTAMMTAHTQNVIFDLKLPGEPVLKTIAREIQHDPVSRHMIHIDFQHIDMSKKIHVKVAIHLVGEPDGVKNQGGILEHVAREIEVSCLPADIPEEFRVDVSHLVIGTSVHVSDIPAQGFEFLEDPNKVIALVVAPTVEKTPAEEAAAAAETEAATAEAAAAAAPEADAEKK
jgi:large subunit ribosomal protein L25